MEPLPENRIDAIPRKLQPEHLVSESLKMQLFVDALRKLACLGNGKHLGNSEGNIIAQRALARAGVDLIEDPKPQVFTASIDVKPKPPVIGNG